MVIILKKKSNLLKIEICILLICIKKIEVIHIFKA